MERTVLTHPVLRSKISGSMLDVTALEVDVSRIVTEESPEIKKLVQKIFKKARKYTSRFARKGTRVDNFVRALVLRALHEEIDSREFDIP